MVPLLNSGKQDSLRAPAKASSGEMGYCYSFSHSGLKLVSSNARRLGIYAACKTHRITLAHATLISMHLCASGQF